MERLTEAEIPKDSIFRGGQESNAPLTELQRVQMYCTRLEKRI